VLDVGKPLGSGVIDFSPIDFQFGEPDGLTFGPCGEAAKNLGLHVQHPFHEALFDFGSHYGNRLTKARFDVGNQLPKRVESGVDLGKLLVNLKELFLLPWMGSYTPDGRTGLIG
jgi:hypothetical protein